MHMEDDAYVTDLPADFYSSNAYGDKMFEYLNQWYGQSHSQKEQQSEGDNEKSDKSPPFFAYLAFSAPHWPLQAPKEFIEHYRGVYDEGPDVLRRRRLRNLVELGLVEAGVEPHPVVAPDEIKGWDDMSESERKMSARAMEAYAGMVEVSNYEKEDGGSLYLRLTCLSDSVSITMLARSWTTSNRSASWTTHSSCS